MTIILEIDFYVCPHSIIPTILFSGALTSTDIHRAATMAADLKSCFRKMLRISVTALCFFVFINIIMSPLKKDHA